MFNLSCISVFNNPIFLLCPRSPPCAPLVSFFFFRRLILFKEVFMDFLKRYKKMIALRGLTAHTMKSYCTYISAYLDYISNTLHKYPSQVRYSDIIRFLDILQQDRGLSDRTINTAISQIRFFTLYVLHNPWDPTQVPMRKFDTYLPFVPSQDEVKTFISSISDIKVKAMTAVMYSSGLRIGEVCHLRYEDIQRKNMRMTAMRSFQRMRLTSLLNTGSPADVRPAGFSLSKRIRPVLLIPFFFPGT